VVDDELVALDRRGVVPPTVLAAGRDFYAAPAPVPTAAACLAGWDHPDMPWDGSELWWPISTCPVSSPPSSTRPSSNGAGRPAWSTPPSWPAGPTARWASPPGRERPVVRVRPVRLVATLPAPARSGPAAHGHRRGRVRRRRLGPGPDHHRPGPAGSPRLPDPAPRADVLAVVDPPADDGRTGTADRDGGPGTGGPGTGGRRRR